MADEAVLVIRGEGITAGGGTGGGGGGGGAAGGGGSTRDTVTTRRTAVEQKPLSASEVASTLFNKYSGMLPGPLGMAISGIQNFAATAKHFLDRAQAGKAAPSGGASQGPGQTAEEALTSWLTGKTPARSGGGGGSGAASAIGQAAAGAARAAQTAATVGEAAGATAGAGAAVAAGETAAGAVAVGAAASAVIPVVGIAIAAVLALAAAAIYAGTKLHQWSTELTNRFEEYSPEIATAKAMIEVRNILADIRRASQAGPTLANYMEAQNRLEQKWEDLKTQLSVYWAAAATPVVDAMNSIMAWWVGAGQQADMDTQLQSIYRDMAVATAGQLDQVDDRGQPFRIGN